MKVKVKHGVCDFCGVYPAEHTINGGLWWLCTPCMDLEYGKCSCTNDLQMNHAGECKFPQGDEEE